MKRMKFFKKTISFALSLSMLFSLMVWSVPAANAVTGPASSYGNTVPSNNQPTANNQAKYRVRLCIHEDDGFDKSIHDNATYVAGVSYGLNNSRRNLNGTSTADDAGNYWCEYAKIVYKDFNGTGTEGAVWFNLGDKDEHGRSDIISSGGQDYGYFPSDDGVLISGFPTSFTTRYYEKGNGSGGYTVYLQVAVWSSSSGWEWSEGTCTGTGFLGIGGWSEDNAGGVITGSTGSISTSTQGTELLLSKTISDSSKYPKAQASSVACSYDVSSISCPSKAGSVRNYATLQFNSPTDQYGAVMAARITTDCSESASGITQSAKVTYIAYAANLAGSVNSQTIKTTVTWPQYLTTQRASAQTELTVNDAVYEVKWQNDKGEEIASDTYSFGDTPARNVPEKQIDTYHYLNPQWDHDYEPVSAASNNTYTAQYTAVPHHYIEYTSLNDVFHRCKCDADSAHVHYDTFEHTIEDTTVAPSCTEKGYVRHACTQCGYYYDSDVVPALSHQWDEGVVTTAPQCEISGIKTFTCLRCGQTKTQAVSALEHQPVLKQVAPSDKVAGGVYYGCENCDKCWAAQYNETTGKYTIPDETPFEDAQQALADSDPLPAPYFNIFSDEALGYDYALRGASLKYLYYKTPDYQPMRFTASVKLPEGVGFEIGGEGNKIADIGFVYSQSSLIGDLDALALGKENVYSMSVKEKNSAAVYDGTNWGGVSKHEGADGTHLTFNLVVNVKPENWSKDYCARAYVKYNYNGFEYTVYDEAFSARSVAHIARQVVDSASESPAAKDYCQSVILDNLEHLG